MVTLSKKKNTIYGEENWNYYSEKKKTINKDAYQ